MPSPWAKYRERLYRSQAGQCRACGYQFPAHKMQIDHIRPRVEGGSNDPRNLQLLCPECHRSKTRRDIWRQRGKPIIGADGLPR